MIVLCGVSGCYEAATHMLDTGALCPVPGTTYGIQMVRTVRPVCMWHLPSEAMSGYPFEVLIAPAG